MSHIKLTLDTTPPQVEIVAPTFVPQSAIAPIPIYVHANEELDPWHEVYFVDADGVRHDYTLLHQGDMLSGAIPVHQMPTGIGTLYARVRDTVHNVSDIATHSIYVQMGGMVADVIRAVVYAPQIQVSVDAPQIKTDIDAPTIRVEVKP